MVDNQVDSARPIIQTSPHLPCGKKVVAPNHNSGGRPNSTTAQHDTAGTRLRHGCDGLVRKVGKVGAGRMPFLNWYFFW